MHNSDLGVAVCAKVSRSRDLECLPIRSQLADEHAHFAESPEPVTRRVSHQAGRAVNPAQAGGNEELDGAAGIDGPLWKEISALQLDRLGTTGESGLAQSL